MKKLLSTCILLFVIAIFSLNAQTRVYPPTLIEPENGDVRQMPNVTLNWTPITGINGVVFYDVELDKDPAFNNPTTFNTDLSGVKTSNLEFNEVYYWRVKAIDGPDISDWSETWSFQIVNYIKLKKPDNNKTDIPPSQELTWDTISGVTNYDIQLDTSFFWKKLPDSTSNNLNDAYFTSATDGWIVGDEGTIVHVDSFDLTIYPSPVTENLYGVAFASENEGFAVGAGGAILYYDGTDWTQEANSPVTEDLNDIFAISGTEAWAVGAAGTVIYYSGGAWTTEDIGSTEDLHDIYFVDASNGWLVGDGGDLFYYDGSGWTNQDAGSDDLFGVYFLNANMGFACGESGTILEYDGAEWTEMDVPSGIKDLFSICFTGAGTGYAIGEEGDFLQYGGEWYEQTIGSSEQFNSIFFADGIGYIVGNAGQGYYDDGLGFSSLQNIYSRNPDSGSYVTKFMPFGKTVYWRVRARHSMDTSDWSGARALNTLANVTLVSPDDNAIEIGLSDEYSWEDIDGVLSYEAQFATNENFSNAYIEFTEDVVLVRNNLFFGTEYYWRVRANHATDTSDWSEIRHFTTINTVILSSPANNATDIEILPTLVWEPISGVDAYQVAYDTMDLNNPCCEEFVEAPSNQYNVMSAMANGKTYMWRVRAIKGADTTEWSPTWSFTIEPVQGIGDLSDEHSINIFPNPSNGTVFIEYDAKVDGALKVMVTDLAGQTLLQQELMFNKGKSSQSIDLSTLPNGIYIIRYSKGDRSFARKITLTR
jgi:hypothetical protein